MQYKTYSFKALDIDASITEIKEHPITIKIEKLPC